MTKDEALKLALEALEAAYARLVTKCEQNLVTYNGVDVDTLTLSQEAITAIKEALAQPEQERTGNCPLEECDGGPKTHGCWAHHCEWKAQPEQEPVFWYRPVGEDGLYEGPIHNASIERVRKLSGAWVPLYPHPQRKEQESVACVTYKEVADTMNSLWGGTLVQIQIAEELKNKMLYTTPPQRTWVGLTDEEMHECWDSPLTPLGMKHVRMIEAKLKEKNT